MFITDPTGSLLAGWKASICAARSEPTNELIAVVTGFSEAHVLARAQAVKEAIEKLDALEK